AGKPAPSRAGSGQSRPACVAANGKRAGPLPSPGPKPHPERSDTSAARTSCAPLVALGTSTDSGDRGGVLAEQHVMATTWPVRQGDDGLAGLVVQMVGRDRFARSDKCAALDLNQ